MSDFQHLSQTESAINARARRAAQRAGLYATKSTYRRDSWDNHGGFMLVDAYTNIVVEGVRYELSAQDVIEYCNEKPHPMLGV